MWSFPFAVTKQAISDAYATESLEKDRAWLDYEVFMRLSNLSVASGLYATLIGLLKMLNHIDGTSTIGPAMAFALLPLFYGLILGEFVFKSRENHF